MTTIYALIDPLTSHIRYVGKTRSKLSKRLGDHVSKARQNKNTHVYAWIRSLLIKGSSPEIIPLEITEDWQEAEQFWIAYRRMIGCNLTNHTVGGETSPVMTNEVRQKISKAQLGKKRKPLREERKAKISLSLKGQSFSSDRIQKIKAATKLAMNTPEIKAKLGKLKGRPCDPKHVAKRALSNTGRKRSPEAIKRMTDAQRLRRQNEVERFRLPVPPRG